MSADTFVHLGVPHKKRKIWRDTTNDIVSYCSIDINYRMEGNLVGGNIGEFGNDHKFAKVSPTNFSNSYIN